MTMAKSNTMGLNSTQIVRIQQKSNQFWSAFLINLIQNLVPLIARKVRMMGGKKVHHSQEFLFLIISDILQVEFRLSVQIL